MRVDGEHHLFYRGFELHRGYGFGDQLGGLWADDVHAQNLAILLFRNHFDETVMAADDAGFGVCGKGELADLHFVALLLGLRFSKADTADLRLAIRAARNQIALYRASILTDDLGYRNHPLHSGNVR